MPAHHVCADCVNRCLELSLSVSAADHRYSQKLAGTADKSLLTRGPHNNNTTCSRPPALILTFKQVSITDPRIRVTLNIWPNDSISPLELHLGDIYVDMIIDKPPLLGDEMEIEDAPPSYDALENVPGPSVPRRDEKTGPSSPFSHIASASPTSPLSSVVASRKTTSKRTNAWFNFGPSSRATKEVRTTILGLLRDLIKQSDAAGALGVLESCADACKTYDLSLSSLMQEKSIEGHTPIYWAIINRPSLPPRPEDPDLLSAVLSHAAPLTDATVDELRLACLHTSDHALFQKLRRSPAFSPLTGREELITGGSTPVDDVDVEDVKEDEVSFVARFKIPMFQKRMRISGAVRLEFIAKGEPWCTLTSSDVDVVCDLRAPMGAELFRR